LYAKFRGLVFDIAFSRKIGDKHPLRISHQLRTHVLICPGCFHDGIDMNPAFMSESAFPDKRSGFQGHEIGSIRHISGKRVQLGQFFSGDALCIHFFTTNRYDGCEIGISTALPITVNGTLHHGKTRSESSDGIGHCNPAIVMCVDTEFRFHVISGKGIVHFDSLEQFLNNFLDFKGKGAAVCVTENDDIRAGLYGG